MTPIDFPAAILLIMLLGTAWIAIRAQRREDFDWANALRDDGGKESAFRLAIFISLVISSWMLIYLTLNVMAEKGDLSLLFNFYLAYLAVWSGAKIVERLLDVLLQRYGGPKP